MSETDSFVEEVTEEIRRDRLYGFFRKYGWLIALVLALIVGGAIFNEWRKARIETARQTAGDALIAAISSDDPAAQASALAEISGEGGTTAVIADLGRAAALSEGGQTEEAIALYSEIAERSELNAYYSDLARLKALMLNPEAPDADQMLELLTNPGRPYWLLALELRAQRHIEAGDIDAALADLMAILEAPLTTQALRQRAQQLTIVLGGEVPQQPVLLPSENNG